MCWDILLVSFSSLFMVSFSYLNIFKIVEHYFTSMWDEYNCVVIWAFFGIAFLWDLNENWTFPVVWPLLSFPNLLAYWVQHFHSIIFQDWNSSTGMPLPPLALIIVMLSKTHLTSHSRMSGSRWVITPLWLSGSWRSFRYSFSVYSCHLFLISSAAHLCNITYKQKFYVH